MAKSLPAQEVRRCGTRHLHEPNGTQQPQPMRQWRRGNESAQYFIPVVFHVVHNGSPLGEGINTPRERILSQMRILNEDFRRKPGTNGYNNHPDGADTRIEFFLAQKDPQGQPTDGILRLEGTQEAWQSWELHQLKQLSNWPPSDYLNIWIIDLQGGFLGFSTFPESELEGLSNRPQDPANDGIVLHYEHVGLSPDSVRPYHLGRSLTHEMGHFLGLLHPWGINGGCDDTDYVPDTPETASGNFGCHPGTNSCPDRPGEDLIQNYMDFSDDSCMNLFTNDQVLRMAHVLENSPRRKELARSHKPTTLAPQEKSFFKIQPNPTAGELRISRPAAPGNAVQIRVMSPTGQTLLTRQWQGQATRLSLGHLPAGLYFIRLRSERFSETQRLIIR